MAVRRIVIHAGHQKTGAMLMSGQKALCSIAATLDRLARENAELRRQLRGGKKRRFEVL